MVAIETDDLTISELFSGRFALVLPEFQREYRWSLQHAEHLIEDIEAAAADLERTDEADPYFLGTMLFVDPGANDPLRQTQVVDGQQRITTLTILLAILRDLEADPIRRQQLHRRIAVWSTPDGELTDAFHFAPRRSDRAFFARTVQKDGASLRLQRSAVSQPTTATQSNVAAVRSFLRKHLKAWSAEERAALADFILDNCRVLAMRTSSLDYAYQIFLTINGRGMPLSEEDIIVAEVIGPLNAAQRRRFEPILDQIGRYRDAEERSRSRSKTFFTHLVGLQGWGSRSVISDLRRAVRLAGGPSEFSRDVFQPMAEAYLLTRRAYDGRDLSADLVEQLDRLALLERICDDEWVGCAMIALANFELDDPDLVDFLWHLDRFAHAQLILRSTRLDRRKRYRRALGLIGQTGRGVPPEQAFALTMSEQQKLLARCGLQLNDTTGRTGKAVLIRLDAQLSGRPIRWYHDLLDRLPDMGDELSVEHVMPRGRELLASSPWASIVETTGDRQAIAECLGNLLLVGANTNAKVEQLGWPEKRAAFLADPLSHEMAVLQEVADIDTWDLSFMSGRHRHLLAMIAGMWDIAGPHPGLDAARKGPLSKPLPAASPKGAPRKRKRRSRNATGSSPTAGV